MDGKLTPQDAAAPKISAVICTIGTRGVITRAVEALLRQTLTPEDYEILLVINAPEVPEHAEFKSGLRSMAGARRDVLRFVHEPRQGLSLARNTGIREARGRYVAFIDDDALADPDWLEQIAARFERDERIASVGGNIVPEFAARPPAWVTPVLHPYFSCMVFSRDEEFLAPGRYFFGTNMAFRKDLLEACGGFHSDLGRKGGSLLSNEEWTVFRFIDARGLLKLASPRVRVRHVVPASRLRRGFFIRRLWWQGVSDTVFHLRLDGRDKGWVLRKAWKDFRTYYGNLRQKLKAGVSTPHMAFFNLFRWVGILYAVCTTEKGGPCAAEIGRCSS